MSPNTDDLGPGLAPAIFLGILTFLIGVILGTASMISQEVAILTKSAKLEDLEPGTVYFIRGDRLGRSPWEAKEEAWKAGTVSVLTVTEQELNQWSAQSLQPESPPVAAEEAGWMDKLDISVSAVNFRILDEEVQLSTELRVPGLLGDRFFIYQVKGGFVAEGGELRFKPAAGTLGCAPLGSIPAVKGVLFSYVCSLFGGTDAGSWLPGSLEGLNSAVISDGQLVLKRG